MKKRFIVPLAALLCLALLGGCRAIVSGGDSDGFSVDELSKAQKIVVFDAAGEEKAVLTEEEDIDAFVESVNVEDWRLAQLPEGLEPTGSFQLWQTETITAFMGEKHAELHQLCTFQCYRDALYLTIDTGFVGITITFSIPQETADYLQGLWE